MDPQGSFLRGPARAGVHGGKQVFFMCMRVAWSLTVTPLYLFYGDTSVAQLPSSFLLSDTLEEVWVSVQVVPGHTCQGAAVAVSSVGQQKSVLFLFRVQVVFFLLRVKSPSPLKSLRQLDFIWQKLKEIVEGHCNRSLEFHPIFRIYGK